MILYMQVFFFQIDVNFQPFSDLSAKLGHSPVSKNNLSRGLIGTQTPGRPFMLYKSDGLIERQEIKTGKGTSLRRRSPLISRLQQTSSMEHLPYFSILVKPWGLVSYSRLSTE